MLRKPFSMSVFSVTIKSLFMVLSILISSLLIIPQALADGGSQSLTSINADRLISGKTAQKWHKQKSKFGPTYSGSDQWLAYLKFLEKKLKKAGVVDIHKNNWTYDRWYTSEWPDVSGWSLVSNGEAIKVSHYGANSGSTSEEGLTANLIFYKPGLAPEQLKDKIVVFPTSPHPNPPLSDDYKKWFTFNDYEYYSDETNAPELFTQVPADKTVAYDTWWQLQQTMIVSGILQKTQAVGAVIVFDMGAERLAGLYTFPVLPSVNKPVLYVDRDAGGKLINDAQQEKPATLRLVAKTETVETYQLIGYLPGKHYGTDKDERILLTTHTDGPNLQQENGALGLLGIVDYFSHIKQKHRPRTLLIYFDNRHYMPGLEAAYNQHDWFTKNPHEKSSVVALIATEHLGQMEFTENAGQYVKSGRPEVSLLWTRNNQELIDSAINAVKAHQWSRVFVQSVERPGIHGGSQGIWYGLGAIALQWDIPAFATMGIQGGYWTVNVPLTHFDVDLFITQVSAMAQLTGELMLAEFK